MKWLLIFLIFASQVCYGQKPSARAIQHIQKAAYTYPVIKGYAKTLEKEIFDRIPIPKQYISYVGSIAMTAASGQINTRKFKNLNVNFLGGNMRPDMVYDFRTKETSGLLFINWQF